MNMQSRSKNTRKNLFVGICNQFIIIFMSFFSRTIFIRQLGAEYLGLNGLFTNILTVLSLAELGIGNVMIYSLYKPIADKNEGKIASLLLFYKAIYKKIAIAILILGLAFIPFLGRVVNSEIPFDKVVLYYTLYLINSVASYLVAYKTAIINADQKLYIIKTVNSIITIVKESLQILTLILFHNFTLYLIILILGTITNNIILSVKAGNMYPFIKKAVPLKWSEKTLIYSNIKSTFLYKIGVVLMNNTDNILISIIVGTVYVGYYSNYMMVISVVNTFISILIQGIYSSVGNLQASGNIKRSYEFFNIIVLFFQWLSTICSICFLVVFNDFISIWIGDKYVLDISVVLALAINFYIQNIINPVWIYRETMGLYSQIKYLMIIAATINLILSLALGYIWGIFGIIISTAISRILTTVWYEPKVIFKEKFKLPLNNYWNMQIKQFILAIMSLLLTIEVIHSWPGTLTFIFIKIIIVLFIVSTLFFLFNYRTREFLLLFNYANKLIRKQQ